MSIKFGKCLEWKNQMSVKLIPLAFHTYFFNFCMGTPKGGDTSKIKTVSVEAVYLVTMKTSA